MNKPTPTMPANDIEWHCLSLDELSNRALYELLKLRVDVFVVEQQCLYSDLDNKDLLDGVYQLLAYRQVNGEKTLVACARLLAHGISYDTPSIGRVIVHPQHRGGQLGHQLMQQAIETAQQLWGECVLTIGAQSYLENFYRQHGFISISPPYDEDGIEHLDMQWSPC